MPFHDYFLYGLLRVICSPSRLLVGKISMYNEKVSSRNALRQRCLKPAALATLPRAALLLCFYYFYFIYCRKRKWIGLFRWPLSSGINSQRIYTTNVRTTHTANVQRLGNYLAFRAHARCPATAASTAYVRCKQVCALHTTTLYSLADIVMLSILLCLLENCNIAAGEAKTRFFYAYTTSQRREEGRT